MLRRDWRAGELRVLALALLIAVGGMTTVGFFADRVQLALSRQGNQLLGADLIIFSDHPLPQQYADEAKRLGLATSTALKFPSMAAKGDNSILTEIKAVTAGYPLRGDLRISEEDAYLMLQKQSRQRRLSMREVAEAIILSEEIKRAQAKAPTA